jgi:TonB family protein
VPGRVLDGFSLILQSASVKFIGHDVEISEGGVSVATSTGMAVSADAFTIAPAEQKQRAVVLEALIGRDGNIQALHVLSGPAILSAAAREAVKQWRFKPCLQSGQNVETKARIVVNFTIFT